MMIFILTNKVSIYKMGAKKGTISSRHKQYWINKNYTEDEAIKMARSRMPGTVEYYEIFKHQSHDEAVKNSKLFQSRRINTLDNFIERYGPDQGLLRFNEYRAKQAYSNSFEYKSKKHNWSLEEYDAYNAARASTKENFIKRYGEIEGADKWKLYVDNQRYAGVSLKYFIEKLGVEEGTAKYNQLSLMKSHSYESYLIRCDGNSDLAMEMHKQYILSRAKSNKLYWSKVSQTLFESIKLAIDPTLTVYYATLNSEFPLYSKQYPIMFVDFYVADYKKAIEFNGDYWHANPNLYKSDDVISYPKQRQITAKEVWKSDEERLRRVKQNPCINEILIIWEYDFVNDPKSTLDKCITFLQPK